MRCIEKTLYTNGRIVTMDAAGTVAEAVLVAGNVIEAVGSKDGLAALAGPGCRTVDLKGASLYPGFIDTHSHASLYAMWKTHCRCPGIAHLEDVYPLIRRQAERVRGDDGIVVYNFDDTDIPERRGPTKRELDAVMPDRPVLVFHISGHTCYANSKALERIGVNPDAPFDDVNVFLGKDGLPNGYIAEEMAFKAMGELMPALDQERHKALVRECVAEYNAQGFTSAHDSAVGIGNLSAETVYRTYNQLYESGELNMRVYLATMEQPFRRLEPTGLLDGPGNRFVQYSAVKTLADGSIQAGTAAIPEGYFFDPSLRPGIIGTQDYWDEMVYHWHSRGRQLSIHCNGVGAIETIITAVERAQARCPRKDARHLIIHCQMATDEHVRRMKEAGILPSFYGLHVWNWGDRHRDIFLGPDRAARLDPAGSAVRAGLPFSLHADTPVLPQMTMLSIHTAVNRETKGGAVLGPDQRISTLEAVRAYTSYAALFSHSEAWRGTIEPGKVADFVIPSEDILEAPAGRLVGITFAAAIVDNRVARRTPFKAENRGNRERGEPFLKKGISLPSPKSAARSPSLPFQRLLTLSNPVRSIPRFLLNRAAHRKTDVLRIGGGVRFCEGEGCCAAPPFSWGPCGGRDSQRSLFFSYCGPMTFIYSTAEKNSMIRPRMNASSKLDISAMSPPRSTAAPMPTSHAIR